MADEAAERHQQYVDARLAEIKRQAMIDEENIARRARLGFKIDRFTGRLIPPKRTRGEKKN